MRIDSLIIPAFGPFTDFRLDFPKSDADIHIVYGKNEAGKSTLLRAIHNLFFGIPARSGDNFLHDYGKMLLGAQITHQDQQLLFYRKKGNKNTLIDAQSQSIPDGDLQRILGPINEDFFDHMFGLSTDKLRSGAESLLSGNNEIGNLLFSASLGGTRIDKAIEKLEKEAALLAKGGARTNVRIPVAINRYKDAEKRVKEASVTAKDWKAIEENFQQAQADFYASDKHLNDLHRRREHIQGILSALPLISRLDEKQAYLQTIQLPELATDFQQRVRQAQTAWTEASAALMPAKVALQNKCEALAALPTDLPILEVSASLEALHQGIQQHLSDLRNIGEMKQLLNSDTKSFTDQLAKLGYTTVEDFAAAPSLTRGDLAGIKSLAEQLKNAHEAHSTELADLQRIELEIQEKSAELAELEAAEFTPDQEALLRRTKDQEAENKALKELHFKTEENRILLGRLSQQLLPSADLETIRTLIPPSRARVTQLLDQHSQIIHTLSELQRDHKKLEKEAARINRDLEHFLTQHGQIVSKDDLAKSRAERDQSWLEIKNDLLQKAEVARQRLDAFDESIAVPDQMSDQLLQNADAAARAAGLRSDRDKNQAELGDHLREIGAAEAELDAWQIQWDEQIKVISQRTFHPSEMLPWLDQLAEWHSLDQDIRIAENKLAASAAQHTDLLAQLQSALALSENDLSTLRSHLERVQRLADTTQGKQSILEQNLAKLKSELKRTQSRSKDAADHHAGVQAEWQKAIDHFQINLPPAQIVAHLEDHLALAGDLQAIHQAEAKLGQLERQTADFSDRLQRVTQDFLPDFSAKPVDEQEKALWLALTTAREHATKADAYRTDIDAQKTAISQLQAKLDQAETQLNDLVKSAGLDSQESLEPAILEHDKRLTLKRELQEINAQLTPIASGQELDAFLAKCRNSDPALLMDEQSTIETKLVDAQHARDAHHEGFLNSKRAKESMELASSAAIAAKQDAENALAEMSTDTQRFLLLHHAIDFLKAQIEAYREQAQGPLIRMTSHLFSSLTCGEFSGVAARPEDNGSISLVALRPAKDQLRPATELATHELSEGTRDQLYLALRLAAIEKHLDTHPSMPLILDDVLMTFDDTRSTALLEVLTRLSQKTQILIFTHHHHNLDLAKKNQPAIAQHTL